MNTRLKMSIGGMVLAAGAMMCAPAFAATVTDAEGHNVATLTKAGLATDLKIEVTAFQAAEKAALVKEKASKPTATALATFKASQKTATTNFHAKEAAERAAWKAAQKH